MFQAELIAISQALSGIQDAPVVRINSDSKSAEDSAANQGTGKEEVDITVRMSFGAVKTAKALWQRRWGDSKNGFRG